MTVRIFRSTDVSAPALSGSVGSLIGLLDALLINGYGALAVSGITRSGTTVTVTLSANNATLATGDRITISGANEADYNGEFEITVTGVNTFTYQIVGTPATPATGSLFYKKAGMGWTKEFAGTNVAAYLQPAGTSQFRLRVDDTGTTSARVIGYEAMSDVNTGTGPFPTNVQQAGGLYTVKSSTADATARPWVLLTNDSIFYLFINSSSAATSAGSTLFFGDFTSYKPGDNFKCLIAASISATLSMGNQPTLGCVRTQVVGALPGHFVARDHTGVGSSLAVHKLTNASLTGSFNGAWATADITIGGNVSASGSYTTPPYPNPVDGGLYVERIWIGQPSPVTGLRGELPGLWAPMHNVPLAHGDTYSGAGALAGKKFEAYSFSLTYSGQVHLEISNTW